MGDPRSTLDESGAGSAPPARDEQAVGEGSLKDDAARLGEEALAIVRSYERLAKIALLRRTLQARRLGTLVALGGAALVTGVFALAVLVAFALFGAAGGMSSLFDMPLWVGALAVGLGGIVALALGLRMTWKRQVRARLEKIKASVGTAA